MFKCIIKHNWTNWGEPFRVYGTEWKQSHKCKNCGIVKTRSIGLIQSDSLHVSKE